MPRDSNGINSLPPGTIVSIGDTVLPSQHNPFAEDVSAGITNSLSRDGQGGMRSNLNHGGFRGVNMADGVSPTDAATVGQIQSGSYPVGGGMDWFGEAPPPLFMWRDGRELSRTDYAELFAVIGTRYGAGNGSTTFNIPDSRGRADIGRDDMGGIAANRVTTAGSGIDGKALGASGGAQGVALSQGQMPAHNHSGSTNSAGNHSHAALIGNGFEGASAYMDTGGQVSFGFQFGYIEGNGDHTHTITTNNTGNGESHNNMQPVLVCNKIIKVRSA